MRIIIPQYRNQHRDNRPMASWHTSRNALAYCVAASLIICALPITVKEVPPQDSVDLRLDGIFDEPSCPAILMLFATVVTYGGRESWRSGTEQTLTGTSIESVNLAIWWLIMLVVWLARVAFGCRACRGMTYSAIFSRGLLSVRAACVKNAGRKTMKSS